MADIPDDVMEMAWSAFHAEATIDGSMRAALRVGVEWERARIAAAAENFCFATPIEEWVKMTKKEISARALTEFATYIRSRTNPDDCNPSDYT